MSFPKTVTCISTLTAALTLCATFAYAQDDTATVFNRHIQAFSTGDMALNLSDYSETSVIIVPNATYTGLAEIEGFFTQQMAEFGQEGVAFKMGEMPVLGNVVYISWSADTPDNDYSYATETYVIEDGKITTQTVGWVRDRK